MLRAKLTGIRMAPRKLASGHKRFLVGHICGDLMVAADAGAMLHPLACVHDIEKTFFALLAFNVVVTSWSAAACKVFLAVDKVVAGRAFQICMRCMGKFNRFLQALHLHDINRHFRRVYRRKGKGREHEKQDCRRESHSMQPPLLIIFCGYLAQFVQSAAPPGHGTDA